MKQCDAVTLASTYAAAHRCLKKTGVRKIGKRNLCAHHRTGRASKPAARS
ncbi:MAG: hypothetical protein HY924_15100 [Elusimicrobia bacterium]|nr:hypothetical protein [Elusimicrobiota bacterium]